MEILKRALVVSRAFRRAFFMKYEISGHQYDRHSDGGVRYVEYRPYADIEEIYDRPIQDAIDQIANCPAQCQRQSRTYKQVTALKAMVYI